MLKSHIGLSKLAKWLIGEVHKAVISIIRVSCLPQSFFDGWDSTKKKDKTKGRHDTLTGCKLPRDVLPFVKSNVKCHR